RRIMVEMILEPIPGEHDYIATRLLEALQQPGAAAATDGKEQAAGLREGVLELGLAAGKDGDPVDLADHCSALGAGPARGKSRAAKFALANNPHSGRAKVGGNAGLCHLP